VNPFRNNKRVGLMQKLGRAAPGQRPQIAARVRPAEPRAERAMYLRWVRSFFVLWAHVVSDHFDLRHDSRIDAPKEAGLTVKWNELVSSSGVDKMLTRAANRINKRVKDYYSNIFRVSPPAVPDEAQIVNDFRQRNIQLIQDLRDDHIADLEKTFASANAEGMRHEELAQLIQKRIGVGESRARTIARDQTLKYNSSVHVAQAQAAGLEEFTWSTSHDAAVRPMHKALDGHTFRYDDPPVTNTTGEKNLPGQDIQCRCLPIPKIPLFEPGSE